MSTSPEIVPSSETMSQTAQEGLGVGSQVIAKSEMPGIGHSGETRQLGQEGLRLGQDVTMSTTPEVGQCHVETGQPVVSGSTSEMSLSAASDCNLKSEQMGGVQSKGQSSDAATQNPNGLTGGTKLQSVSEKKSVEVKLFEASMDSEWFVAIERKDCKELLRLFRSNSSLWVQTGLKGRSVLHVAVMQGCSELVHELHHYKGDLVPCGKNWNTPFQFLWENARDGRLKDASAQDIWLVMEGPVEKETDYADYLEVYDPVPRRSRVDYLNSHDMWTMPVDEEMLKLRDAISNIASKHGFLMDENDVDFNFENAERKELYLHMACSMLRYGHRSTRGKWGPIELFIIAVISHLSNINLLQRLFDQKDAQGRTILQILVNVPKEIKIGIFFSEILNMLPHACVNSLDKAGRTVLHWAVGHNYIWAVQKLLSSDKIALNSFQTQYYSDMTILNLILLYEYDLFAYKEEELAYKEEKLAYKEDEHTSMKTEKYVNCILENQLNKRFVKNLFDGLRINPTLDTLSAAVSMGKKKFVEEVMETEEYSNQYICKKQLLSYAAYSGNVEILQFFLQKVNVDNLNVFYEQFGAPPLHLAVEGTFNAFYWEKSRKFNDYLHCNDFISIKLLENELKKKDEYEKKNGIAITKNIKSIKYSARQACATLLLQAGVDILITDKHQRMADPGEKAPNEGRIWWYELVANQIANMRKDLNAAGTKTAVVATLVATASFVGPLTPPLNYVAMSSGTTTIDVGVQVTKLLIKVFLVSNSLSFYLAITSIMLAVMPSLPIPKEGLVYGPCDDLKRNRRTISIAIGMLLLSIITVLVSFAASSLIVLPLQYQGLMAYSTSIGGIICCIGFVFFFLRFLRLIFPQNTSIKRLYQRIGKL